MSSRKYKQVLRPDFSFEDASQGPVCGVDEAGRGPLAGPVVAAAVIVRRAEIPPAIVEKINDSKLLTANQREYLFHKIHELCDVSVAECSVDEIDTLNILQASLRAMSKAVAGLKVKPVTTLVDGNQKPKMPCIIRTIVDGDAKSVSIAAASIIAKHYRDSLMIRMANNFPQYGWHTNAGYGTAQHMKAIEIHGVTIHHRRSFAPVSKQLLKKSFAKN